MEGAGEDGGEEGEITRDRLWNGISLRTLDRCARAGSLLTWSRDYAVAEEERWTDTCPTLR